MNLLYFCFGTIFGSFYNVVIFRLPTNQSIISPRSHCYSCKKTIPFYLNIPILSYILCLGKCYFCKTKISYQYPIIEFLTGLLWYFAFTNYNLDQSILFIFMTGIFTIIALIDLKYYIIPTSLIIIASIGLVFYNIYNYNSFTESIFGLLFALLYLGSIALISSFYFKKQTLGYGDILLVIILGAWLGIAKIALTIFFSALIALLVWIFISLKSGFNLDRKLPFGFYLSIVGICIYILKIEDSILFF